jgi:hypothetical protein
MTEMTLVRQRKAHPPLRISRYTPNQLKQIRRNYDCLLFMGKCRISGILAGCPTWQKPNPKIRSPLSRSHY